MSGRARKSAASTQKAIPPDPTADIEDAFERLQAYIKNGQHKKALKTADEILGLSPKDEDAQHVKISALLQLFEWEQALQAISKSNAKDDLKFEKAYCLYRLGRVQEGLKELNGVIPEPGAPASSAAAAGGRSQRVVAAIELSAQLHYRLEGNKECIQLYDTLFQQYKVTSSMPQQQWPGATRAAASAGTTWHGPVEHIKGAGSLELRTNVLAAYVAAGLSQELEELMAAMKVTAKDSFEIGYNKACGLAECGRLSEAETELRRALKLGRETLFSEELSEEEVEAELAPLTVQLAYVLGRLGRSGEATELYDKVTVQPGLRPDPPESAAVLRSTKEEAVDGLSRAVATNNLFADSGRIDALPAHKKSVAGAAKKLEGLMEDASKPGSTALQPVMESRLSSDQKRLLTLNRALTYLLSGRLAPAKELAEAVARQEQAAAAAQEQQPQPAWAGPQLLPLLQAALLAKEGKAAEADAVLAGFAAAQPRHGLQPTLARAQLALEAGDVPRAAQLLALAAACPGAASSAALLSTRVALHQQMGDAAGAEALLEKVLRVALQQQQQQQGGSVPGSGTGQTQVQCSCLEQLVALRLKLGKVDAALDAFSQLQGLGGANSATAVELCARLLRVLAASGSTAAAASLAKQLPSVPGSALRGLDVDALEGAGAASRGGPGDAGHAGHGKRGAEQGEEGRALDGPGLTGK
ncbi:hypothetical protein QJQ45_024692, partial [Haematococcus lacustris]